MDESLKLYELEGKKNPEQLRPSVSEFFRKIATQTAKDMTPEERAARARAGGLAKHRKYLERKAAKEADEKKKKS